MSITPAAQALAKQFTVAQLREMILDEGGVAAPSKLRKAELAQYLDDIRYNQAAEAAKAEDDAEQADADLTTTVVQVGDVLHRQMEAYTHRELMKLQARVAANAWRNNRVEVTSMGEQVQGKVVALELRERPGAGHTSYDYLLVVAHDGHAARRTLHALGDVKLLALAS